MHIYLGINTFNWPPFCKNLRYFIFTKIPNL